MINDGSNMDCSDFVEQAPSVQKCDADIFFNFTFTNVGLACIEIVNIRVALGPQGSSLLRFDDIYGYNDRKLCFNETWVVPDRRSNVNLCEESVDPWEINIEIYESSGQKFKEAFEYELIPFTKMMTPSTMPSVQAKSTMPSVRPSGAPSIDVCSDCTLISIISGCECFMPYFWLILFFANLRMKFVLIFSSIAVINSANSIFSRALG